jgi:transcriptional regulator with XRE-family HTH domain
MTDLRQIGILVAAARKEQKLALKELARRAGVNRTTIYLLESGRAAEIGYSRLARILAVLGLELRVEPVAQARPTLEDLLREDAADD